MTKKAEEFTVSPDWPAFRKAGIYRGIQLEDGEWVLIGPDGKQQTLPDEELEADYEPCQVWG